MTYKKLTRDAILKWLSEKPGLTNNEIAELTGQDYKYVSERMRYYEQRGYVRRKMRPGVMGPYVILWFYNEQREIKLAKAAAAAAMKLEEANRRREEALRQAEKAERVQRVCAAPAQDNSVVRRAIQSSTPLEAAWRGF